jgi:sugar phosphate isomerase/epimerase
MGTAAAAVQFSSAATASSILPNKNMNSNFKLKVLATNWGFNGPLDAYCAKVKKEGYDGIEIWWPLEKRDQDELFTVLKKYELEVGFLCAGSDSNYQKHFDQFTQMIDAAANETIQRPLYINCHSGRDYFSYEEGKTFINHTNALAKSTGIKICHETHRSRLLYAAPVARHYMETIPELRITFDVSHWCNVHESLLEDQQETVNLSLQRVDHIHARVGHAEGPQVNDPRAPEWDHAVKAHFAWWDKVVELKKQKGDTLTILTEFGPPDYMPTLPYTRQPLADQWAVNVYMMQQIRNRYQP